VAERVVAPPLVTRPFALAGRARRAATGALLAPMYRLYTDHLRHEVRQAVVPHHVAVILDGNRRWASEAGLRDLSAGHRHGADKIDDLLDWCSDLGIGEVTLWALSGENLSRGSGELAALLDVVAEKLDALVAHAARRPMRIRVFGRFDGFPPKLLEAIERAEAITAGHAGLRLNIALGYSGRGELVDACRALVSGLAGQGIEAGEMAGHVTGETLAAHLYTAGGPDPDLIIRTSGEVRLSGFLPWQSAHSEFHFTDVYWPAFRELDFLRALRTYQQRERRFGR
jgi:short-chain Z-isoprenyl diphosphate synthase